MIEKIISGGQTGADRGGLEAATELNLDQGGWCPAGRRAEDGPIPLSFNLKETNTSNYQERTRRNIEDSDATLIVHNRKMGPGSHLTAKLVTQEGKPLLLVDISSNEAYHSKVNKLALFLFQKNIKTLNVAGSRESTAPGIQVWTKQFLIDTIRG